MRPLDEWPAPARGRLVGVMTDIDDTLTRDGAIEPAALDALHALDAAGVPVVAITGRPAGWSEPFAAAWPVRAIVAENGAVALLRRPGGGVDVEFAQDAATRAANARRLAEVAARILAEVPGATLARDSAGRVTDIAVDHAEHARLEPAGVEQVLALMRIAGLNASISSIHVNGWIGAHDKLSAARWMLRRLFGCRTDAEADAGLDRWAWIGDSTNDQALFGAFGANAVGVANLADFADRLHTWPAWITRAPRGAGFAEFAQAVLAARRGG